MDRHPSSDDHAKRPPDEIWWERELLRREKSTEAFLPAAPETLELRLSEDDLPVTQEAEDDIAVVAFSPDFEFAKTTEDETVPSSEKEGDRDEEKAPDRSVGYAGIAGKAGAFAVRLAQINGRREVPEILWTSAGKIGVNLAGGHGLGYEDETLCGNIVKCRWALADCRFCIEILEQLIEKTRREEYVRLLAEAHHLGEMISNRIRCLRQRVRR